MVDLKKLAGLVKNVNFTVVGIEDESTETSQVLRVELKDKIKAEGSIPLSDGTKPKCEDNFIYVRQDIDAETGEITEFMKGLPEDYDGQSEAEYKGTMKLDVAKPKFNNRGEVTQGARIWLKSSRFSASRGSLLQNNRKQRNDATLKLFGRPVVTTEVPDNQKVAVSAEADDL